MSNKNDVKEEDKKEPIVEENAENKQESSENKKEEVSLSPEEEAVEKFNEINDKYLRLYSEFDNFRKRTQKEKIDLYKNAGEEIISALLPILDDFERAKKAMEDSDDVKSIKEGMNLIHNKINVLLKQKGLEEMETAKGKEFNVEFHEAITQIPAPTKKEKGKILDEVEKGYLLNGKVIRYTKVVVGK